jgi:hypothetical protein
MVLTMFYSVLEVTILILFIIVRFVRKRARLIFHGFVVADLSVFVSMGSCKFKSVMFSIISLQKIILIANRIGSGTRDFNQVKGW